MKRRRLIPAVCLVMGTAHAATQAEVRSAIEAAAQPRPVTTYETRCGPDGMPRASITYKEHPMRSLAQAAAVAGAVIAVDPNAGAGPGADRCGATDSGASAELLNDGSVRETASPPRPRSGP